MPFAVILRMAVIFVISFLAYKFLDILFDMAKSYFKQQNKTIDKDGEKKGPETIETKFVENSGEDKNE